MNITSVSDKYQIKKIREKLAIDIVGSYSVLSPQTGSYARRLAGLGKKLWKNENVDPIKYIRKDRQQWENKRNKN